MGQLTQPKYTASVAVIEEIETGKRLTLAARCLVGRAEHCSLTTKHPLTSAEHAVLEWRHERWTLRDLGSSNGTQLNGSLVPSGKRTPLTRGAIIEFGSKSASFRMVDLASPAARAVLTEGGEGTVIEECGLLALPSAEAPEACIYRDDEGSWWVEYDGPARHGVDQELLVVPSGSWRLQLPAAAGITALPTTRHLDEQPTLLDEAKLVFTVSRDEEHVQLHVVDHERDYDLGTRAHHYMLLTLARARLQDAEDEEDDSEQGWQYADELARAIGTDLTQLNLHVFRARQQLAKAGVLNAGKVIERRAGSRQLRLGPSTVVIQKPQ